MRLARLGLAFSMMLTTAVGASAQPNPGGGDAGGDQGSAPAATDVVTAVTAEQLAQAFVAAGFQAEAVRGDNNTKLVRANFWPGANITGGALLDGCDANSGRCTHFRLLVIIPKPRIKQTWVNAWNSNALYVRAYMDDSGQLYFEMDVALLTGVSPAYLANTIKLFQLVVDQSSNFKG